MAAAASFVPKNAPSMSAWKKVLRSLPQGSVLSSILFNVYDGLDGCKVNRLSKCSDDMDPAPWLVEASTEQMMHHGILPVSAAAHRVNHLQIQTRSTAALPQQVGDRGLCHRISARHRGQSESCGGQDMASLVTAWPTWSTKLMASRMLSL